MKTQVNLFDTQLLPVSEPYNLQRLSLILVALLLVIFAVLAVIYTQQYQLSTEFKQAEQQLKQEQNQLTQFQQLLSQRAPSTDLLRQQEKLQLGVERHQRLISLLKAKQTEPELTFSQVMSHLTDVDAPQLWLTEFRLQQRRSEFFGQTNQSSAVPDWMSRLGGLPYFQGQRFQGLTMQQHESNEVLSFHVVASPGEAL
ncbi:MAG: PilN domain-containing protein [Alkalimonas sp.]|nr:PilN domain-containing protein [Alkalimonas sp.]